MKTITDFQTFRDWVMRPAARRPELCVVLYEPGKVPDEMTKAAIALNTPVVCISHCNYGGDELPTTSWTFLPAFVVFYKNKIRKILPTTASIQQLQEASMLIPPQENNYMAPGPTPWETKSDPRYFANPVTPGPAPYMAKLDKLVGMAGAKAEVVRLANTASMSQKRKAAGLKPLNISRHMVFRGNPGTGKTTYARIIAEAFKYHGLLSAGRCIEVDRSNLVGQYIGHSEAHTKAKLQEAIGSVLFIDEFYALTNTGISNDFGKQVIDLLVKFMEDHREDLVVIVAGYTDEMDKAIASNPGLKSRFSRYIDFPDYSAEELLEIFDLQIKDSGLRMTDNAYPAVWRAIKAHHACRGKDFGNARDMRTFFERLTEVQADRVISNGIADILTIEEADIEQAATLLRVN